MGHLTLARFLSLYEAYKLTLGVAGHIAEIGVFKGAGSLLFAKLTKLFEPETLTLVHGFDWFQGARVTEEESHVTQGECREDYGRVMQLIQAQGLDNVVHILGINTLVNTQVKLMAQFKQHNDTAIDYLTAVGAPFVVLNWEKGDGWNELCSFLGTEVPKHDFPHRNKSK